MKITRDRRNRKFILSQDDYIDKVFQIFHKENAKDINTHFLIHLKLKNDMFLKQKMSDTICSSFK